MQTKQQFHFCLTFIEICTSQHVFWSTVWAQMKESIIDKTTLERRSQVGRVESYAYNSTKLAWKIPTMAASALPTYVYVPTAAAFKLWQHVQILASIAIVLVV